MVLEILDEWDRRKEKRVEPRREPINMELDGEEKTTLVEAELTELRGQRYRNF